MNKQQHLLRCNRCGHILGETSPDGNTVYCADEHGRIDYSNPETFHKRFPFELWCTQCAPTTPGDNPIAREFRKLELGAVRRLHATQRKGRKRKQS